MAPTRTTDAAKGGGFSGTYAGLGSSHSTWRGQAKIPGWAIALIVLFGFMLIAFACMFFYFMRNERIRRQYDLKPRRRVAAGRAALCAIGVKPLQIIFNRLGWRHDCCGGLCGPRCTAEKLLKRQDEQRIAADQEAKRLEKEKGAGNARGSSSSEE